MPITITPTIITYLIVTTMLLLSSFLFSTSSQASSHESITEWQIPTSSDSARTLTFKGEGSYDIN